VRELALVAVVAIFAGFAAYAQQPGSVSRQAVIVHFDNPSKDWSQFHEFEKSLRDAITQSGAGEYNGNALATDGTNGALYFFGPDADKLFLVIKAQLLAAPFLRNVTVTLRYGSLVDQTARIAIIKLSS
jgi:hypothetical protein